MYGSSVEGVRERFAIQKHKNGDGMILCNRLATFRKEEGVGYVMLKNKIGTNCDFNTKMVMPSWKWGNDTAGLRTWKIGVLAI